MPIALAVWLAHDEYDYNPDDKNISTTSLIKPLKQLILAGRVPREKQTAELDGLVPSRIGTAIHNAIENTWVNNYPSAMKNLGYPDKLINRIRINPSKGELEADSDIIPVYMEQRTSKEIDGYTISGKYDFIIEDEVQDFKSTGVYTYIMKSKDADYILQGSIYRWLNQDIVKKDTIGINYIFTNWAAAQLKGNTSYPPNRAMIYRLPLMSLSDTELYIQEKLKLLAHYFDKPENEIPACSDQELWRNPDQYKYYKNPDPAKRSRSTKNFDSLDEANIRLADDKNVGIVITKKGNVGACKFCPAALVCQQKDAYLASGELTL